MDYDHCTQIIERRFKDAHGAVSARTFDNFLCGASPAGACAALGYRRASDTRLFLESYLDAPIEQVVSAALNCVVTRKDIVELGNLASESGFAMVGLWGQAANDLGAASEIAVATLTAPMRSMFARIGLPIVELAPARPDVLGQQAANWGRYYDLDPSVCAGRIAEGQQAIARYFARRAARKAA